MVSLSFSNIIMYFYIGRIFSKYNNILKYKAKDLLLQKKKLLFTVMNKHAE